ncbi:MAG: transposase [Nitrospirales bacterium]
MTYNPADHVRARHAVPQPAAPLRNRRSIRLSGFDYSQDGAYFVTVCTKNRDCVFGEIEDGNMVLNSYGQIVSNVWRDLPDHYFHVRSDQFVVMPNHKHGIIMLNRDHVVGIDVGAGLKPATTAKFHALPEIIRGFKTFSSRRINELRDTPGTSLWQRNYYEHIIRDDDELNRIRQYILDNPAQWETTDRENPNALQKAATIKKNFEELGV